MVVRYLSQLLRTNPRFQSGGVRATLEGCSASVGRPGVECGKTNAPPWSRLSQSQNPEPAYDATGRRLGYRHAYATGVVTPNASTMGPNSSHHPPIPPGLYGGRYRGSVSACYPLPLFASTKPQQHVAVAVHVVVVVRGSRARFYPRNRIL